jgi:hypothetical protein
VAGAQLVALIALLGGTISWLFKLAYGAIREDRDWWRKAYADKEANEWSQVQVMAESIAVMRLLLEKRRAGGDR